MQAGTRALHRVIGAAMLGFALCCDEARACEGDSGDAGRTLCVPADLKDTGVYTLASALTKAVSKGFTRVEIDGSDALWAPQTDECAVVPNGASLTITSASPGTLVSLPGVRGESMSLSLVDAELIGRCEKDLDGFIDGDSDGVDDSGNSSLGLFIQNGTLSAENLKIRGTSMGGVAHYLILLKDSSATLTGLDLQGATYPAVWVSQYSKSLNFYISGSGNKIQNNPGGGVIIERASGHNGSAVAVGIEGVSFAGNVNHSYSASDLHISEASSVKITSSEFTGQKQTGVELSSCTDSDGYRAQGCSQGLLLSSVGTATLNNLSFSNYEWGYGPGLTVFGDPSSPTALSATDLSFTEIHATEAKGESSFGGGAMLLYYTGGSIVGVTARDLKALRGALIYATGPSSILFLEEVDLQGFEGPAMWIVSLGELTLRYSSLCDGLLAQVGTDGAFLYAEDSSANINYSVLRDSSSTVPDSSWINFKSTGSHYLRVRNNTLTKNGGGYAIRVEGGATSSAVNNIFQTVPTAILSTNTFGSTFAANNLFDLDVSTPESIQGTTYSLYKSLISDPGLWFDYTAGDCSIPPYLGFGSAAIDAGEGFDPDGTVADIGAFGGESARLPNEDGDDYPVGQDCNDDEASAYWGADEVPYDGVDNDCTEETRDDDLDQDGYVLVDDCDDSSSSVNPGAQELPDDLIDQDCDGAVDEVEGGKDSGDDSVTLNPDSGDSAPEPVLATVRYTGDRLFCATGSPRPLGLVGALMGLLLLCRRRTA